MEHKNLMQEMREKYYPYDKSSKNLTEALEFIKVSMESGAAYAEFWTYWTDLPDDWVIEHDTLKKLQEQGFSVKRHLCDDERPDGDFYYVVAWDEYDFSDKGEEYI